MVQEKETDIPNAGAEASVEAPVGVTDTDAIVEFIDDQLKEINAREVKSNYHNARKSAFTAVRNLIQPPPPKPAKEKKSKAKSAAAAAGNADVNTDGESVESTSAPEGDTGAA